jgi:lysophospholipase L1-like esterase
MAPSPVISGPAAQSATSPAGAPVAVSYPSPTVSGGTAPFSSTCTPPSGAAFPIGTTSVLCTVRDADERSASCRFDVSVTRTPQLSATRFMAFGDSITAGVLGTECPPGGGVNCSITTALDRRLLWPELFFHGEATPAAYPRALQGLLAARYTAQTITIGNEGLGGEFLADGRIRLNGLLSQQPPQILLLLEGANDMNQARPRIDTLADDLRTMVRDARNRGITVFLATLVPQRQNACRGYDFCDGANDTVSLNARIRLLAATEGAVLVDLYPAFDGQTGTLLGLDGLHPNEAGYRKMAEVFFEAIQDRVEVK